MPCGNCCFSLNCGCCPIGPGSESYVKSFDAIKDSATLPAGRILIFINPKSGAGQGLHTFRHRLEPKLRASPLSYEAILTESAGHANQIVQAREDLERFDALLICSGDGLVYEVVNGILERQDGFALLRKLPIGIVPSGSGNGLLSSVFHARSLPLRQEDFLRVALDTAAATDTISVPVSITHISTPTQHLASFLSLGWGLLADIDIESERLRKMCGSRRFVWGALSRVARLRTYLGRLSFLEAKSPVKTDSPDVQRVYSKADSWANVTTEQPRTSDNGRSASLELRWKAEEALVMPAMDDAVPADWKVVDDEFVFVYMVSTSHINNKGMFAPNARLDDPSRLYLTYALKSEVPSKAMLVKFLASIETGEHLKFSFCHCVEVSAFRLETLSGYVVVDGEIVNTSRIQASVTDLTMRVMCT